MFLFIIKRTKGENTVKKMISFIMSVILLCGSVLMLGSCANAVSIESAEVNSQGELVLTLSDGSELNAGSVIGRSGKNGKDGMNGIDGTDGTDGIDGINGESAYAIYLSAHPEYKKSEKEWIDDLTNGNLVVYDSIPAGGVLEFATISETEYQLYSYTGADKVLNIPSTYNGFPVTSIYANAFRDKSSIRKVNLPNTLKHLDGFYGSGLESLIVPDSVTSIDSSAFYNCAYLKAIYIPKSVTEIGSWAFGGSGINSSLVIYCEAESQPLGWASDWNPKGRTVLWGQSKSDMVVD